MDMDISSGDDFLEEIESVFTCFEKPPENPASPNKTINPEEVSPEIEIIEVLSSPEVENKVKKPDSETPSDSTSTAEDIPLDVIQSVQNAEPTPCCSKSLSDQAIVFDDDDVQFIEEVAGDRVYGLPSNVEKQSEDKGGVEVEAKDSDDEESQNKLNNIAYLKSQFACKTRVELLSSPGPNSGSTGYRHEVVWPIDSMEIPLLPIERSAKSYKFELDPFQNAAIVCIDNYQSVLISAHTSAGKTAAAEYAIAKAFQDFQRVIYTTPIKALSNQKYSDFLEEFIDVGIITGDVSINPNASCLVMTTEVLREMLYRGSEVTREIGWVIFDEIHYMKDKNRGVVWEETIILLPSKAHFVFLSATIPNSTQFAQWIASMHNQACNVIDTDFRPVPLHHNIYDPNTDELVRVINGDPSSANTRLDKESLARLMMKNTVNNISNDSKNEETSPAIKAVKKLLLENKTPVLVFSFSKADCELYGVQLSDLDFNTDEEKDLITEVFTNAVDILTPEDQQLPQVVNLLPLLLRGIGIHHGGLLPIMKETVEILFYEGLVKILCATETFAMGLNMPAHSVVFTSLFKFDGEKERLITSGEYIQMSGRAGRRNYDDCGDSVVILDERLNLENTEKLLMGRPDSLDSSFHLTYNMILNLMRAPEINPEYMIDKSFYYFQKASRIPEICEGIDNASKEVEKYKNIVPMQEEIASYYVLRADLTAMIKEFSSIIRDPKHMLPFLQIGRLVHVRGNGKDFGWGIVVNYFQDQNKNKSKMYIINVLMNVSEIGASSKSTSDLTPQVDGKKSVAVMVPVSLEAIFQVGKIRVTCQNDLTSEENQSAALRNMQKVMDDLKGKVPAMDFIKDMKIRDPRLKDIIKRIQNSEKKLYNHSLYKNAALPELYNWHHCKLKGYEVMSEEKEKLNTFKELVSNHELKNRKRVLRKLEYLSSDDILQMKGKIACEITGCDELLLTEMIFHGVFLDLDAPQCVALLSCLVCREKSKLKIVLPTQLQQSFDKVKDLAKQIAEVSKDCNVVTMDAKAYVDQFKPVIINAVYEWCKGCTFAKLLEVTDVYEGAIIRNMRSLDEILRQMTQAAKVMGNKELETKFTTGMTLIKRDIVFAASLYL